MISARKNLSLVVCAVLILLGAALNLELWAERRFARTAFNDEARRKIVEHHPDAIFIGNSVLSENILKPILDHEASRLLGRRAKILYIHKGGMHSAWHYLVLRNQIAASGIEGIPVFILDYEDFFVRPEAKTSTAGKSEQIIRENIDGEPDEVFLRKIGSKNIYFISGFPYLYSQRYKIKRYVAAKFVRALMSVTGASRKITSRRWKAEDETAVQWLLGMVFKGANFRGGGEVDDMQTNDRPAMAGASDADFDRLADASFLPELLKFADRYPLTFVQSNSNPSMPVMKTTLKTYSARLERYLTQRGAHFIDLNRAPELQEPDLMHDSRHFSKGRPRELNTKALVSEIERQRLLR